MNQEPRWHNVDQRFTFDLPRLAELMELNYEPRATIKATIAVLQTYKQVFEAELQDYEGYVETESVRLDLDVVVQLYPEIFDIIKEECEERCMNNV